MLVKVVQIRFLLVLVITVDLLDFTLEQEFRLEEAFICHLLPVDAFYLKVEMKALVP